MRRSNSLALVRVEAGRNAYGIVRPLAKAENVGAQRMEYAILHQFLDGIPRLKARVQLDQRIGPQRATVQLALHITPDPIIPHFDKAFTIGAIIDNELLAKVENVHWLIALFEIMRQ